MDKKLVENNEPGFVDQTDPPEDNYAVNLDDQGERLYDLSSRTNRPIKFWIFLIFAFFILMIVGYRFYGNIINPLKYDVPEWLQNQLSAEEEAAKTIAELKETDTDQDGLNDYQEIYQYYTSIFLPDTDSDGFTDGEEVNLGEDPICPIGESCNLLRLITPNTKLSSIVQDINLDPNLTVQEAAVKEFRKFLLDNGFEQKDLDALSDEDLLAIFRITDESNILDGDKLSASSTPEQIRNFLLLLPGVDTAEINAMSEEELMAVADELIAK